SDTSTGATSHPSPGLGEAPKPPSPARGEGQEKAPRDPRPLLKLDFPPPPAVPTVYELLARYWKHPLPGPGDDRPTARGVPDAAAPRRAEDAGWVCREFTLSVEAAVALVSRGVPFILTLVEAGFSQPRLCVGADAIRGTVSVVDGLERRPVDAPAGSLQE